jgi:hypothetical protein
MPTFLRSRVFRSIPGSFSQKGSVNLNRSIMQGRQLIYFYVRQLKTES